MPRTRTREARALRRGEQAHDAQEKSWRLRRRLLAEALDGLP